MGDFAVPGAVGVGGGVVVGESGVVPVVVADGEVAGAAQGVGVVQDVGQGGGGGVGVQVGLDAVQVGVFGDDGPCQGGQDALGQAGDVLGGAW